MLFTQVSYYKTISDTKGTVAQLQYVLEQIKECKFKSRIEAVRAEQDVAKKKVLKERLPNVTFAGVFAERFDQRIEKHSGLICIDFDHIGNRMGEILSQLQDFPYTVAAFVSPSGDGIKGIIRIKPEHKLHRRYFYALKAFFPEIDQSGVNESRTCFLSCDPSIFINYEAEEMPVPEEAHEPPKEKRYAVAPQHLPQSGNREENMCRDIYQYLWSSGHSITYEYNDWIKVGYALLNSFDYPTAEDLFCLLSSIDTDKYDEAFCKKTLKSLQKNNRQPRGFGYIVTLANLAGWTNISEYSRRKEEAAPLNASKLAKIVGEHKKKPITEIELPFLYTKASKGNTLYVHIDEFKLLEFVESMGYVKLKFDDGKFRFFQLVEGSRIKEVEISDMTSHLRQLVDGLPNVILVEGGKMELNKGQLHSMIFSVLNDVFTEKKLNYSAPLKKPFLKDTKEESFFTFGNGVVAVGKDGIDVFAYKQCQKLVWSDDIVEHDIEIIPTVESEKKSCEFAQFLWYLCGQNDDRFLQMRTAIGYALRTYRDPSVAVAVLLTEEKIVDGTADGGTGKGVLSKALEYMRSVYVVDGKLNKISSQFAFQRYDLRNNIVSYQDGEFDAGFSKFFNVITDGLTIERKNNRELWLPFKATNPTQFEAPVWWITTNMPIKAVGNSVKRRLFICEVSSWWKDHSIYSHFGHNLYYDWDKEEWNKFYNFMLRCVQSFLNYRLYKADSVNAELNNLIAVTNKRFVDWFHNLLFTNNFHKTTAATANLFGKGMKLKPFANRNDLYRDIADYCGWGYTENHQGRVDISPASLRGGNNAIIKWLETGCKILGIGYNDRAKGTSSDGGKQVSTFEFTVDVATMTNIKNWLFKYHDEARNTIDIDNEGDGEPELPQLQLEEEHEEPPF